MVIDWVFLVSAAAVLGALGLGLYACNWLTKYTTMRHEEKLQARLEEREQAHLARMQEMHDANTKAAASKRTAEPAAENTEDGITEEELNEMMAASLRRINSAEPKTPKTKKTSKK